MRKSIPYRRAAALAVLLLTALLVSGCAAVKNIVSDPVVRYCGLEMVGGVVVGGVAANTLTDSTHSERVATIVGGVAGGAAGFLLCRNAFRQAQELRQRIAKLDAQRQGASSPAIKNGQADEMGKTAPGDSASKEGGARLLKGDTPSGPAPPSGHVVENLEVVDNRAARLDLNSTLVFASGEARLQPTAFAYLDLLASSLKENPESQIHLLGHTDSVGNAARNRRLSKQRAEAVATYMSESGIAPQRLETEGLGEEEPVADNATPQGRAQNRRVEVVIVPTPA